MRRAKVLFGIAIALLVAALLLGNPRRAPRPASAPDRAPAPIRVTADFAVAGPAALSTSVVAPAVASRATPLAPVGAAGVAADIGECPQAYASIPVVWCGRDRDGRPTWRHQDGSVTQRAVHTERREDGVVVEVPAVLHFNPSTQR